MKSSELVAALARKLKTQSQRALADALGVSGQTLVNWSAKNQTITPAQVASALAKSQAAALRSFKHLAIQPIVEFYALDPCLTKQEKAWQLFSAGEDSTSYARGLKETLDESHGIYIFYDSRGRALYVGKARQQSLWKEMNLAFNRQRAVQKITLVAHPDRNQEFQPGHEKLRQPRDQQLELADLSSYFSAYQVDDGMIDDLEALMARGFANDLLNKKMETFANSRG